MNYNLGIHANTVNNSSVRDRLQSELRLETTAVMNDFRVLLYGLIISTAQARSNISK